MTPPLSPRWLAYLLSIDRLRRLDARVRHVGAFLVHADVVITVIGDLVRGPLGARGLQRIERVLVGDLECPITSRESAREDTRKHEVSIVLDSGSDVTREVLMDTSSAAPAWLGSQMSRSGSARSPRCGTPIRRYGP